MKKIITLLFLLALVCVKGWGQVYTENFNENWTGATAQSPAPTVNGWTSNRAAGNANAWHRNDYTTNWGSSSGSPSNFGYTGNSGDYYARFHTYDIASGTSSYITTPNIDLSSYSSCTLTFYYINKGGSDVMNISFSSNGGTSFTAIGSSYTTATTWTQYTVSIPASYLVANFQMKFTATSDFGTSDIGLDQVVITGVGFTPLSIGTITATQQATGNITKGSTNNNILSLTVPVTGNTGTITLNSLTVNAANTNNADIATNGVKLWTGTSTAPVTQIGTAQSFSGGAATFSGLTTSITATTYLWVTYDISATATVGDLIDATIPASGIALTASGGATAPGSQPPSALNPAGNGTIALVYCTPTYSSGGANDIITNVSLPGISSTLSNNTAAAGNPSPYYHSYTSLQPGTIAIPSLQQGSSYTLTLTFGNDADQYNGVWIDFNQNGTFETTEFFTSNTNAGANGTAAVTITVPAGAVLGNTLMRIRGGDDFQPTSAQPCGASGSSYGEAEDYTINVTAPLTYIESWSSPSTGSATWCAGETRNVSITVTNTGTATWVSNSSTGVNLSYYWSNQTRDQNSRILPFTTPGLAPGQQKVLTFPVTATSAGTYTLKFDLVKEGACWFGDNTSGCSGPGNAPYTTSSQTINALPTATISYASPFCTTVASASPTITGAGITTVSFASAAGLSINTATGVITPSTSTPGTYTVTYTFTNGTCSNTATTSVTINATPTATISYASPFCTTVASASPTITGQSGGTFSSTTGLTINGSTGVINPSTSTAGTYTVTYTFTNGTCSNTTTASVTINTAPTATISYASPFCFNTAAGAATSPTITGQTGGTFTSTTGLTINGSTGVITPSTSTPGTYTVTYTFTNGTCQNTATASVTINTAPSGTFSYTGSPYCSTVTSASPTTSSLTSGGTYSSTTGLAINGLTGVINPSTSTAGSYTVTYTVTASGCSTYTTTASITINTAPSGTFSYTGSPYCSTVTLASPTTSSLTSGGTYSSTTGLAINGSTGVINPSTSTAGSYTVTYTVTASGCSTYTTTASVTINTAPSITSSPGSQTICAGATTTFTVGASGSSLTYQWQYSADGGSMYNNITGPTVSNFTFAGYNTSATLTVTASASAPTATYLLRCVVSSAGCSPIPPSASAPVIVNALPTVVTVSGGGTFCGSTTLTAANGNSGTIYFEGTTSNGTSTATPSTSQNITTSGTYYFRALSTAGCWGPQGSAAVTINPIPAVVTVSGGGTFCGSTSITASGGSGGTIYFEGTTSNGTATNLGGTPQTITTSGTYYFRSQSAAGCWGPQGSVTVTINAIPTASASSNTPVCLGTTLNLTGTTTGGASFTWSGPSSFSSTAQSPSIANVTAAAAGVYTFTASANGCNSTPATTTVAVNAAPTSVSVTPLSATACSGASTTLSASATTSASKIATGSDNFNGTSTYAIGGTGTSGVGYYQIWAQVSSPYSSNRTQGLPSISSPDNSKFMLAWVNNFNSATVNSTLTSPAINTTSYANLSLSFQYTYYQTSTGMFTVEVSTDGTTFTPIKPYSSTSAGAPSFTTDNINLNSYINNSTLYIRFHANLSNTYLGPGAYLGVDNVSLNGASLPFFSWTASPPATAGLPSGAGTFSTTNKSISVQPTATTVYTLTAQDPATGCNGTSTATSTITVNPIPVPTFTTAPGSQVCGKTDVTYTTQAGQSNYIWSGFGTPGTDYTITSGSLSTTSNTVTVQWLTTGSHTVTVNYSNSGNCTGATAATSTTTVLAYPAASIVTGGGAYCSNDGGQTGSGQTISLSGSQTGVTYQLYLNNAPTSTTQTGTGSKLDFFGVLGQGTYTIFATNTTTNCTQFMTGSASIQVNAFPNDYAVSSTGTPVNNTGITYTNCGTANIYLSGSDANTTYTLKRSSTVVTSQPGTGSALTFSVTQVGRYTYSITAANTSCQNGMGSVDVTINPLPTPTFTTAPTGTPCQNTSVTYTTQSGQSNYVWTVPGTAGTDYTIISGGITSTDATVTLTWLTPGSKTVSINYSNSFGCSAVSATTSSITVNPNQTIALTSAATTNAQTVCSGIAITNITYSVGGGGTGATVTGLPLGINGVYNSGVVTISGTATVSTATTYNYTVTTSGTCSPASASGTITIRPNATITLTSGANTNAQTICSGGAITNITYSIGGGGTSATVSNTLPSGVTGSYSGGVFTISGTPTVTGSFNYTVTTSGTCLQTSATGSITISQTPSASFAQISYSSCAPTAVSVVINGTAGATVSYTINGGSTQTAQITTGGNVVLPPSPTAANTYNYLITGVSLGTCTGTTGSTATAIVHALPDATISFNPGTGYVQLGNTITLTDATSGGTWSNTTPAVASLSTGTSTTVTGLTSGTTTVGYTTPTDGNGCFNTSTQVVTVTADFVTKNNGNFSDYHTWNLGTPNGLQPSTSPIPTATTTVEVQHALNLDQNFQVGTGKSFNITGSGTMTILPSITFSSLGTVDFGSKLVTVQSTSAGTGAIGQMATPILNATNVTAERFIGSATFATGKRAWRLLTAPVSGQTINNAWQEGLVSATNTPAQGDLTYGTLITGTRQSTAANAAANGFDFWPEIGNANTSIVYYNGGRWNTFSSLIGVKVSDYPAYLLFVRGNRSVEKGAGAFGVTTLRANGSLNQGAKSFSVGGASAYTLVGNPYAAPIDFEKVYSASTNIQPQFLVWNSQNGLYGSYTLVQRNSATSYSTVPNAFTTGSTSANARFLVSGQGFFVQPVSSSGGTLVINEGAKDTTASGGINPYRLSPATDQRLYVNLNLADDTTTTLADGVLARFDATYSAAITSDDVPKQSNFNENIAIETSGASWIVEARPEVAKTDTVHLKLWNETKRSYQLQVKGENFAAALNASTLHAFLQDSYLGTSQELSLSGSITTVAFTVNSDSASQSASRFRIVFQQGTVSALPVTLTSVSAAPQTGGVAVGWTVTNETNLKDYVVERSTDGGSTFTAIATQEAKNNPGAALTSYSSLDAQPQRGDNLYRIRIEGRDGTVSYSKVVKAVWGEESSNQITIAMYPNPVGREGKVSLQLSNLREGTYLVRVYSEGGQTVYQRKISISQGSSTQSEELRIGNRLAGGSYQLRLTDSKGKVVYAHALIIAK